MSILSALKNLIGRRGKEERNFEDIQRKVESDEELSVSDVRNILSHPDFLRGEGSLDREKVRKVGEKMDEGLGHAVYKSILEDLDEDGIIEELRDDLIDPSKHPEGFEKLSEREGRSYYDNIYLGEEATTKVGSIYPPSKKPQRLSELRGSILQYLFVEGNGFFFDAEMIYDYENDYRELVKTVAGLTDDLNKYELQVSSSDQDDSVILIEFYSNKHRFSTEFEVVSDWVNFKALEPVQKALEADSDKRIYYKGGNVGWIMIVEEQDYQRLKDYLGPTLLGTKSMSDAEF